MIIFIAFALYKVLDMVSWLHDFMVTQKFFAFLCNNSKSCITLCSNIKPYLTDLVIIVLNPKLKKTLEPDHVKLF